MSSLHRTFIWPYSPKSESAKALAEAMDILRVKSEGSVLKGAPDLFIINFGSGGNYFPSFLKGSVIINSPQAVLNAVNKIDFFSVAEGVSGLRIPEWTTSAAKAKAWLNKGEVVLARTELEASNGKGIVVMESIKDFVTAPLYTQFVENSKEYRLYVVDGKVVFTCTKDPKSGIKQTSLRLRTTDHGWAYNYFYGAVPVDAVTQALLAVKACGLDFGGVDLVMSGNKAYVLEVNTAPWMGEVIAGPVGKALQTLLLARGAKTKAQVEPYAITAEVSATPAPVALDPTQVGQFQATFVCVTPDEWSGFTKGATKNKLLTGKITWAQAMVQVAQLSKPNGWVLKSLELIAA